jgi:hypothetical protein
LDLNDLFHRHQVSLFMADNANSDAARRVHRELALQYAARIADFKRPTLTIVAG